MSRTIDGLLGRISDANLRAELAREVEALRSNKDFGLVFERHLPEHVRLYGQAIRRGSNVQELSDVAGEVWVVRKIQGEIATLVGVEGDEVQLRIDELVVVAEFGEPVYPGFEVVDSLERGGDKPFHTVINGENFHVLEALAYVYEGQVDCIYIDPPYNTGARDWKYNNDYVDGEDAYRHSKWLSFMEKRLKVAKKLLNSDDSVLVVTIDEKEYLRLGLLLEQVFPDCQIQMVSSAINPAAVARTGTFGRSDEYLFFVMVGSAAPQRVRLPREWVSEKGRTHTGNLRWDMLRRSSTNAERSHSPGCFYPIYVDPNGPKVAKVGEPLDPSVSRAPEVDGLVPVLPIRKDGSEGNWQWSPTTFVARAAQGRVRITGTKKKGFVVSILKEGEYQKIERGEYTVTGNKPDGSVVVADIDTDEVLAVPGSQWRITSHDATQYGSRLLASLIPGRKFPFPKSLYAVEDALRFFVNDKPDALIIDFFGGSGTTAHAVARLNRQDGGRRHSVVVTNNEVSDEEAKRLLKGGHAPGGPEWEALGIFEHVTMPRVKAAFTGLTPEGTPIAGDYKFTDEFPMSEGFEENAIFLKLKYLEKNNVARGKAFEAIAPLLWLKAGARGPQITKVKKPFAVPKGGSYAVLFDADRASGFIEAVRDRGNVEHAYIVTNSMAQYQQVISELPTTVETTMLYEDYISNFELNLGRLL